MYFTEGLVVLVEELLTLVCDFDVEPFPVHFLPELDHMADGEGGVGVEIY